jgi:hypothetical protein
LVKHTSKIMKEIVTLQLGTYANFVGAHYWNIQNELYNLFKDKGEINSDFLFRYGQTKNGTITCCPRAVVFDLSGTLGSLRKQGNMYDTPKKQQDAIDSWSGEIQKIETEEKPKKSKFVEMIDENKSYSYDEVNEDLTQNCWTWSDFLEVNYHPKSVSVIENHASDKFNEYTDGALLSSMVF